MTAIPSTVEIVRYHRQLSRSIYVWGVFTPGDFGALIVGLALNMLILNSSAGMVVLLAGYPAYLAVFRLGRPPGNDVHFFRSFTLPCLLRPGRSEPDAAWRPLSHVRQGHQEVRADE
jgi:hypothetical protein